MKQLWVVDRVGVKAEVPLSRCQDRIPPTLRRAALGRYRAGGRGPVWFQKRCRPVCVAGGCVYCRFAAHVEVVDVMASCACSLSVSPGFSPARVF